MEWDVFELVVVGLFSIGGFFVKVMFTRMDRNADMLNELTTSQAAMHEQITSLFRNVEKLESKLEMMWCSMKTNGKR